MMLKCKMRDGHASVFNMCAYLFAIFFCGNVAKELSVQ